MKWPYLKWSTYIQTYKFSYLVPPVLQDRKEIRMDKIFMNNSHKYDWILGNFNEIILWTETSKSTINLNMNFKLILLFVLILSIIMVTQCVKRRRRPRKPPIPKPGRAFKKSMLAPTKPPRGNFYPQLFELDWSSFIRFCHLWK